MFTKKSSLRVILKNLLVGLLAAAIALVLIYFLSTRITAIINSLAEKKRAVFVLQARSQALEILRTELAAIGANDTKLAATFPPDDDISAFLGALQDLAKQNSVQQAVQVGAPSQGFLAQGNISVSSIDYTVTLSGTVVTLANYLKGFEALPYFSEVKSVSLNAPSGWEGNSAITINSTLYAKQSNL